ncbi:TPA: ABC transporter substrate-binding protein [Citrobacter freundii]
MRKIIYLLLSLLLASSSVLAANTSTSTIRVATPWPAQNTIIAMLGYGKNIVGTSLIVQRIPLFRQILPSITTAPVISLNSSHEVDPEQILALNTQLLFVPHSMPVPQEEMLQASGVKVLALKANSMQAMVDRVLATGQALGPDAQQKALAFQRYFQRNVELVRQHLQGLPENAKVKVYHAMRSPLMTSGRPSLNQDWMDLAGAQNIAADWFVDKRNGSGEVPLEKIVRANPDVIIVMNKKDADAIEHSPQWQSINAVKNHRIYVNPQGMFWWCRETSEEALQFVWLAKVLYPERFKDVDINKETWTFYHDFFGVSLSAQQINAILNRA